MQNYLEIGLVSSKSSVFIWRQKTGQKVRISYGGTDHATLSSNFVTFKSGFWAFGLQMFTVFQIVEYLNLHDSKFF